MPPIPPHLSAEKLGGAVLEYVDRNAYPDSEDVASAELPAAALPTLLGGIEKAREQVKTELRSLSSDAAPDVDGWIAQAKQLQADIERSRATAHDIVQQAEAGKTLKAHVADASSKVALLRKELTYNETLTHTIKQVQTASAHFDVAQEAVAQNEIVKGLDNMDAGTAVLGQLGPFQSSRAVEVLRRRANQLRSDMVQSATERWSQLLVVDTGDKAVTIKEGEIDTTVEALSRLDALDSAIIRFQKQFDHAIMKPRLTVGHLGGHAEVAVNGDTIKIQAGDKSTSVVDAVEDVRRAFEFLSGRLPTYIAVPVSETLVPSVADRLTSIWLDPSIPSSLDELAAFQEVLFKVSNVAGAIQELGLNGGQALQQWVERAPRNWLARRKEAALASVRLLCHQGVRNKKQVERVETQTVSRGDVMIGGDDTHEDWDAWDAGESDAPTEEPETKEAEPEDALEEEEEDVDASAWGIEDEDADTEAATEGQHEHEETAKTTEHEEKPKPSGEDEDEGEAWGWGDEDTEMHDGSASEATKSAHEQHQPPRTNGNAQKAPVEERELTLREAYTVTAIPDAIMDIIKQVVSDAEALAQPNFADSPIAPAGFGLYSVPTLVLAMYRATASTYYSKDEAANMLMYNDGSRLVDEIRNFLTEQAQKDQSSSLPLSSRPSSKLRLDSDIRAIEGFSKRAYGKEMESQRTILRDLLDSAQGFTNCTVPPFAGECDNAVAMTVDRIREVRRQWQGVLSHSALLQSLGSLLATVTNKIIVDIEDMNDISEEDSKRLRQFCDKVTTLNELFTQENAAGEKSDMTGVYSPNWLKFQYLSEILESSLADIKYLWTEGELKLEFEANEVVDLIEALFAESDYRRRAIAEIRRESMGDLRRYALSTLVNDLLENEKPVPFEFLINGQFLRTSIDDFLTENGISAEQTLTVEYVRALIPPLHVASFEHDDWVSDVDVLSSSSPAAQWASANVAQGQERILSACYDGLLRVWNPSTSEVLATSTSEGGHTSYATSAKFLTPRSIVSAGADRTLRVWSYTESDSAAHPSTIMPTLELYGHKASVDGIAVHAPSSRILSASADNTVGVWSTTPTSAPAAPANLLPSASAHANKRRKLAPKNSSTFKPVPQRGPLSLLAGHSGPVSAAIFAPNDATVAYSTSWDHTLKTWDLPTATCVDTRTTAQPLLSLTALKELNLLAAGTSARHITLVDPRAEARTVTALTLRGHTNAVVSLAADPQSAYGLVSGSHDGTCRIWDIRSVRSGAGEGGVGGGQVGEKGDSERRVGGEGVKVFGVTWDREVGIVSGGEDKRVQVNRGEGMVKT
ncbi:WD40 repeat-like protein [Saccharata proteae CBS 121410]|uniref:Ribosome biogenesis protein YTM1 n=1 Tax=Saccharata proteae CBS 121410 TaxID=1314787 RepID=A0A9P4LYZ3_9PEZI|nr:WD40 repeat-like protein [Saccharata proteae CBS 121410]